MSASNHALVWDDIQLDKVVKAQANAAPAPYAGVWAALSATASRWIAAPGSMNRKKGS